MLAGLVVLAFIWWSYWLFGRDSQSPKAPPIATTPDRHITNDMSSRGLEDDPDLWRSTRSSWTALDELQITRLLRESSSGKGGAPNSTDHDVPHVDIEGTQ